MKLLKELRALSEDGLKAKISELKKELMKYNAQVAIGAASKSPGMIRKSKRTIARVLTILNERRSKPKA